jgi:hypothetical protein
VTAFDASDESSSLSLGVVSGGLGETHDFWMPHLRRLMKQVMEARSALGPLSVNVVFHLEGPLLGPVEFEGVRTGRLSRKHMMLMVQAAVPPLPVSDPRTVLVGLLEDAVDAAEELVKRRSIAVALPEVRAVLAALPPK